jgi:hypothetical protein
MPDEDRNLRKLKWIPFLWIIIVILIVIIVVIVIKCPWPPDGGKTPAKAKVEVILEDSHAAVWMTFDNQWTNKATGWTRWEGVAFQKGMFYEYDFSGAKKPVMWTHTIKFENAGGGSVTLASDQYDWINVVPQHPASWNPPLTGNEGYVLFPNNIESTACDKLDECTPDVLPSPVVDCDAPVSAVPEPCARGRSLRSRFDPSGVVTVWQGPGGYSMTADYTGDVGSHGKFAFGWLDEIDSVEVFKEGTHVTATETAIANLGTIVKITLAKPDDTPHGDMDEPPMTLKQFGP